MPQEVIQIHLRALKQRLDSLVQEYCSPLEQREYFLACEFERSKMARSFVKTESIQHFDLEDMDTQIFQRGELTPAPTIREQIFDATIQIELYPDQAENWFQRALLWKSQQDLVAYMSDLCRAKELDPLHPKIEAEIQHCRETQTSLFFPMDENAQAFTSSN